MVRNRLSRYAFTLIELIFAIVMISIAVISLPVMTQITAKGIETGIIQEAIFAASAELMGASSGYWDLNSMQDNNVSDISRVIDIDPGTATACVNNVLSERHRLRPGHIAQPLHRRCIDSAAGTVASESNDTYPNLDNFDDGGTSKDIFIDLTGTVSAEAAGYKDVYKSLVDITLEDETGAADNNIKKISVTVTNSSNKPITKLYMYSANIGEIDFYKRRF